MIIYFLKSIIFRILKNNLKILFTFSKKVVIMYVEVVIFRIKFVLWIIADIAILN